MKGKELRLPLEVAVGRIFCIAGFVLILLSLGFSSASANPVGNAEVPVKGMVTLVGVCAEHCVPCRMMRPVFEKLEQDYRGRFALLCVDKDKDAPIVTKLKARVTPTLIFFDSEGNEVYRHEGVMDRKSVLSVLVEKAGMK
jgi:thioredoxin 1